MRRRPRVLPVFLAILAILATTAGWAGALEGRWRLVEQHYGDGGANHATADLPVRLEFANERGDLVGRVWAGDGRAAALAWPALVVEGEARSLVVEERRLDAATGEVSARYRVEPAPGDGLLLEIEERYRLTGDDALEGTVHVRFVRDGQPRGGYVLHRRFAREP